MATKNRSGGGGLKGIVTSGIVILILASSLMGWAKVNDISSPSSGYDYFKAWSDKLWSCGAADAKVECEGEGGIRFPGSAPGGTAGGTGTGSGTSGNDKNSETPEPKSTLGTKEASIDALAALIVAEPQTVSYQRSEWRHWTGSPCNTRETALVQQGKNVTQDPKTCAALSGTWVDPYGGDTFTDASQLDIDHVIPLGYVAKHGGQNWSSEKKEQFANDLTQLLATSAKENRSKSDKGPEGYMPRREFQCDYSKIWVSTATKYEISVTEGDKRALKAGLQKC